MQIADVNFLFPVQSAVGGKAVGEAGFRQASGEAAQVQLAESLRQRCAEAMQCTGILNGCVCIFYNIWEQTVAIVFYAAPCRNKCGKVKRTAQDFTRYGNEKITIR